MFLSGYLILRRCPHHFHRFRTSSQSKERTDKSIAHVVPMSTRLPPHAPARASFAERAPKRVTRDWGCQPQKTLAVLKMEQAFPRGRPTVEIRRRARVRLGGRGEYGQESVRPTLKVRSWRVRVSPGGSELRVCHLLSHTQHRFRPRASSHARSPSRALSLRFRCRLGL